MSHVDTEGTTQHTIFTWIGVIAFFGGTVVYPTVKLVTGNEMNPWLIGGIIVASLLAVGSKQVTDSAAKMIEAWRSGE